MKHSNTEAKLMISKLFQAIPEVTQEVIRGGADGSVRFLSDSVASTYQRISNGGTYYTGSVTVSDDG